MNIIFGEYKYEDHLVHNPDFIDLRMLSDDIGGEGDRFFEIPGNEWLNWELFSSIREEILRNPNPQFKTLTKIVMSGEEKENLVKYYGSDEEIIDLTDFNEYGWDFIVNKEKYNNRFPVNFLSDSGKEMIGTKFADIKAVNKSFFPTNSAGNFDIRTSYFGTLSIGKQKLIMVSCPPEYNKVEYFDGDDLAIRVLFTEDEILYSKISWFVVTSGDSSAISDINLAYLSWKRNQNPHRHMNEYLLRNDEASKTISYLESTGEDKNTGMWFDLASGTLIGNQAVENYPILSSKLEFVKNTNKWNKYVTYREGDEVEYRGENWTSISSNNIGNIPKLSQSWVLSGKMRAYYTEKASISLIPSSTRVVISPSNIVIPKNTGHNSYPEFFITPVDGYVLKSIGKGDGIEYIVGSYTSEGQDVFMDKWTRNWSGVGNRYFYYIPNPNRQTESFSLSYANYLAYKNNEPIRTVFKFSQELERGIWNNWADYIKNTKNFVFKLEKYYCNIKVSLIDEQTQSIKVYSGSNIENSKIKILVDGEEVNWRDVIYVNQTDISVSETIKYLSVPLLSDYTIQITDDSISDRIVRKITRNEVVESIDKDGVRREVNSLDVPEVLKNIPIIEGNVLNLSDTAVNPSNIEFEITLARKTFSIEVLEYLNFYVDKINQDVFSGEDAVIKFASSVSGIVDENRISVIVGEEAVPFGDGNKFKLELTPNGFFQLTIKNVLENYTIKILEK